jgi:hypothetical protein
VRVVVVTSCTGEKAVEHRRALTLGDFQRGPAHVAAREAELAALLTPAEALYSGQQHVRLMRGVERFRAAAGAPALELRILSAGYGLVEGGRRIAPYEATYAKLGAKALAAWARKQGTPEAIREALRAPYDLALLLLGDAYLSACALTADVAVGGPTLLLCGEAARRRLPRMANVRVVPLGNQDAKRFSAGLVALKGELAARVLERLSASAELLQALRDPAFDLLGHLDRGPGAPAPRRGSVPNARVDAVVRIPAAWWEKPHREKIRYFIPEWDDLVDPDYDFEHDVHAGGEGDWSNEVYAHQLLPEPSYDGILVSKVVAEKSARKKARINALGVHRFVRLPREFPIMGDCGAFGYIAEEEPPYTTDEILDYYTRLGFDHGVSIDHLIVKATEQYKRKRFQLTVHNAEEFLREHRKRGLPWTPVGAVQGWDPASYAEGARACVKMGYRSIGLGGLVRTTTPEILELLEEVNGVVGGKAAIHLFGLARLQPLQRFAALGVRSVDSASFLRRAWMSVGQNYLAADGQLYAAIRIPAGGRSFRAKRIVELGKVEEERRARLEQACLTAMKDHDAGRASIDATLDVLEEYDALVTEKPRKHRHLLRRTLEARPWRTCPCAICKAIGYQVVVFRGNNRNRRRGFHNTWVFYQLFQRALSGEALAISWDLAEREEGGGDQLTLALPRGRRG